MAKVLIIDTDNVGLSFAWRCVIAGHEVRWFVKPKPHNNPLTGQGFKGVEKIQNWVASVQWADLIFTTSNDDYLERLAFFKKRGAPVFAPSPESAKLEINRKAGMEALKKVGIDIAPYETFPDIKRAEAYVRKNPNRYVFKTMGDNEDKALTYVSKSAADMIGWMQRMQRLGREPKGEVMVQTFIDGIEFGVSRWLGSKGWVGPWNESFEHKKLMSGNYGPATGETATVASFLDDSKIGRETLAKLEQTLLNLGHLGDSALGFIIDDSGKPWPTEWTARPGWPIFNMMLGSIEGDPAQWMIDAIHGKDTTSFKKDIGCCIVVSSGDFPHSNFKKEETESIPIYGVTRGNKKHLHPQAVKIDIMPDMDGDKVTEHPLWNTAGDYNLVVTGYGKTVKQATDRAYKTTKQLHIANAMVRDDAGEALEEQLPELHKHGYATHFEYSEEKK